MNVKSSLEQYSAIALYGINPSPEGAKLFYNLIVRWFTTLGYPADLVSVHGEGFSGKPASFRRINAKLQRANFSTVKSFSIFSLLPEVQIPMNDYTLTASYDNDKGGLYAFVVARSSIASLSSTSMLPIAHECIQYLKPSYGIGYTRELQHGPSMYAIGINQGSEVPLKGEAYEQALRISRWCDLAMKKQVYRNGLLRDVYHWNFLTDAQLFAKINGVSLREWIRENPDRGHLSQLNDETWLWNVTEPNLLSIQTALWDAELMFDWRKFS
jgi:hypothetical protein